MTTNDAIGVLIGETRRLRWFGSAPPGFLVETNDRWRRFEWAQQECHRRINDAMKVVNSAPLHELIN